MGKTIKVLVGVAIGVAIAAFAPAIFAGGLAMIGIKSAVAVALLTGVAMASAAVLMRAVGLTTRPRRSRWAEVIYMTGRNGRFPVGDQMQPVQRTLLRRALDLFARFTIFRIHGDCMSPIMPPSGFLSLGLWCLADHRATVRRGDLMAFSLDGHGAFTFWSEVGSVGMIKRFVGFDPATGMVEVETENPLKIYVDHVDNIDWSARIRTFGSFWHCLRAWWAIRRDPGAYDERLAARQGPAA